jgi:hypothetical protein
LDPKNRKSVDGLVQDPWLTTNQTHPLIENVMPIEDLPRLEEQVISETSSPVHNERHNSEDDTPVAKPNEVVALKSL